MATGGTFEYGIANLLGLERLPEGRAGGSTAGKILENVCNLMNKSMFVADLQSRDPPLIHIGHVAIGDAQSIRRGDQSTQVDSDRANPSEWNRVPR